MAPWGPETTRTCGMIIKILKVIFLIVLGLMALYGFALFILNIGINP